MKRKACIQEHFVIDVPSLLNQACMAVVTVAFQSSRLNSICRIVRGSNRLWGQSNVGKPSTWLQCSYLNNCIIIK